MKTFKSTYFLLLAVIVVGVYAYVFEYKKPEEDKSQKDKSSHIFQLTSDDITGISLDWDDKRLELKKEPDGKWKITKPAEDSVDETSLSTFLRDLETASSTEEVTNEAGANLKTFGLEHPGTVIVTTKDGKSQSASFGQAETVGGGRYALANHKIVLLPSYVLTKFRKEFKDFRNKQLLHFNAKDIAEVHAKWMDKDQKAEVELEKSDKGWHYKGKDWGVDNKTAESFLEAITNLKATDFVSEDKNSPDSKKNFKTSDIVATFEVTDKNGKGERLDYHFNKDGKGYLTTGASPVVYQVYQTAVDALKFKPDQFRDKSAPFSFDESKVDHIDVHTELTKTSLSKENGIWKEEKSKDDHVINQSNVSMLLYNLKSLTASQFLGPDKKKQMGQALDTITLKSKSGETLLELKWGRDISPLDRLVITNKSTEALGVAKATLMGLPLQTLIETNPKAGEVQVKEETKKK